MHPLKLLSPQFYLRVYRKPLLLFNLLQLVRLNNDCSIELVNLCVNDFPSNGFDRPHLDFFSINIKQLRQLIVAKISLVCV
jgi:hypothetical protein